MKAPINKNNIIFKTFSVIFFQAALFGGLLLFFGLGFGAEAIAATYYIKNGGNDSLNGLTDATAWAHCPGMNGWTGTASLVPGDIVLFHKGHAWSTAAPVLSGQKGVLYYGNSYGAGNKALLQAASVPDSIGIVRLLNDNITFDGFIIDGKNLYTSGIQLGYGGGKSIAGTKVNNCEVRNTGGVSEPLNSYWYYAIHASVSGGTISNPHTLSNIEITNNFVHDVGHEGISVYPQSSGGKYNRVNNILVRGNTVYNTGKNGQRGALIDVANNTDNATIEFNYVFGNDAGINMGQYDPDIYGYPENLIVRHNILNEAGINLNSYFSQAGLSGSGAWFGNVLYGGHISIASTENWGVWKFYNNTIVNNYSAGKGSYALDIGLYKSFKSYPGARLEFKNNIFTNTGLYIVRDGTNSFSEAVHSNNLFYRTDSASNWVTTSILSNASAISLTSVAISHDTSYTYFTKINGSDWTKIFKDNDYVQWSGFGNKVYNDRRFIIKTVSANQIKTYNIKGDAAGLTETAVVTGQKWVGQSYGASTFSAYEGSVITSNPNLIGGALPTGFAGTYGVNMAPNTNYFATVFGAAIDNGANLGSPYNFSINSAGLAGYFSRPQGSAYDIGAYEFIKTDATMPRPPSGFRVF